VTNDAGARLPLRLIPLGGLGEFGLNLMVIEYGGDILVVDCGVMFPETAQLGVEVVIPDMSYLFERAEAVRGIVLTLGHEDHIGALPYLLAQVEAPVFGSRMTLGLVRERLREQDALRGADLRVVAARDRVSVGPFEVEFLHVTHSIPESLAIAVRTPVGVIIHTGDFKMDQTPVDGRLLDFQRLGAYGDQGVLALLSDSTNADVPGVTPSERGVSDALEPLVGAATGRVLVSTFASNIHRMQQVIDLAVRHRRQICFVGRSTVQTSRVAEELGLLHVPPGAVLESREVMRVAPQRALVIASGSQGEPMSALARIALDDHRDLALGPGDLVILSARPIPGNERAIARMIDHLTRRGARVIQRHDPPCHVSGHASQEELKILIGLTRPRYLVPLHGEYRQLAAHARLAAEMQMPRDRILLAQDGDVIEMTAESAGIAERVAVGTVLIDGVAEEVEARVLRDRRHLSGDGLLIPVVVIDRATGRMEAPPEIVSRGFVWADDAEDLLAETTRQVVETVRQCSVEERGDWGAIRQRIQDDLRRFLRRRTGRRPMIIPIVIET
jgi:ribonuclease J